MSTVISIRIDDELLTEIDEIGKKEKRSRSNMVVYAIAKFLEMNKEEASA